MVSGSDDLTTTNGRPAKEEHDAAASAWALPELLGVTGDLERLNEMLRSWAEACDDEVRPMVDRQLTGPAKHFRPVTIVACYRAVVDQEVSPAVMRSAAALEITHNVTLIIDDILDRSRYRRGSLSLHCRFGLLPALMAAGYMGFAGMELVAGDSYSVSCLAELMQRLAVAECYQWRVRRHPLGVEDWRHIAGADTGTMFEICARLGTRDRRLARFGLLLGILYHGCDDVADVRGAEALGGGSEKDISDGILTLPAAVAIRDAHTASLFRNPEPEYIPLITERLVAALPAAERHLDRIAAEAEAEARGNALYPGRLLELVGHTRELSRA